MILYYFDTVLFTVFKDFDVNYQCAWINVPCSVCVGLQEVGVVEIQWMLGSGQRSPLPGAPGGSRNDPVHKAECSCCLEHIGSDSKLISADVFLTCTRSGHLCY